MFCLFFKAPSIRRIANPRCQRSCPRSRCPGEQVRQEKGWDHPTIFFKGKKQANWVKTCPKQPQTRNRNESSQLANQKKYMYLLSLDVLTYIDMYIHWVWPRASPSNSDQPGLIPSDPDPQTKTFTFHWHPGGENHTQYIIYILHIVYIYIHYSIQPKTLRKFRT